VGYKLSVMEFVVVAFAWEDQRDKTLSGYQKVMNQVQLQLYQKAIL